VEIEDQCVRKGRLAKFEEQDEGIYIEEGALKMKRMSKNYVRTAAGRFTLARGKDLRIGENGGTVKSSLLEKRGGRRRMYRNDNWKRNDDW